ncbi:xylulokinase [Acerihabitans sp. KWT182]|uniref:Xylulose kinase n=1 Tax=Acerihabitans sp. KWT182 TaxID=3157919 RepID=A0AAU7QE82_9GAMM
MIRDIVAGIDSSTQSCTVLLRSLTDGAVIAQARAPHPPTTPPCSEQDPEAWWQALREALGELSAYWPRIAALSVGGQGHGLVILDENDRPLRPAKLWNDTESAPQARWLSQQLLPQEWAAATGSVPGPAMTIAKLAWTERHHPGLLARSRRIMLPFDYLVYRLCGRCVTERGGASGTGYFNPFDNSWQPRLAGLVNADIDWLARWPEIVASHAPAGEVTAAAGLPGLTGALVGVGTGDNMSAALGMDVQPGDLVLSLGTSGTLYGITPLGIIDPTGTLNGYADNAGRYMPMVTTLNAAKVSDTFRRLLQVDTAEFDALALSGEPGAGGLMLLPYLDGERTPNLPDAHGRLDGLRTTTTAAHVARAAVEGVLCGLLAGREALLHYGFTMSGRLLLTGGAARSEAYRQILADLAGQAVWVSPVAETAAAGAAVQAAAVVNGCDNAEMARRWSIPLQTVAQPRVDARAVLENYMLSAHAFLESHHEEKH